MYFNIIIELLKRNNGNCNPNYCYPSERIFIEKEKTGAVNNPFFFFFQKRHQADDLVNNRRVKGKVKTSCNNYCSYNPYNFFYVILYKNDFSAI